MIKISKISKTYLNTAIVENLTLTVRKGSVFGFLGPNGAGKTTTMKMLVGLNSPDSGSISIDGENPAETQTRAKIGFMPENPYFYDHLTGLELLRFCYELSLNNHTQGSNDLYDQILADVGLSEARNKMINTYSKGMKQRLGLAQAIIHDPDYIFLDEPLDGLDPIGRIEIKRIIMGLKKQKKTVFFNSHILSDVAEICDEIGIINKGKLVYIGPVKKFCGKATLEEAFVEKLSNS